MRAQQYCELPERAGFMNIPSKNAFKIEPPHATAKRLAPLATIRCGALVLTGTLLASILVTSRWGEPAPMVGERSDYRLMASVIAPGDTLVTAGADGIARIWDGHSKRLIRALPGGHKAINAVAFNPKGDTLVTAGADGITRIWDGHSKRLIRALPGGHKAINAVAFNPKGDTLVTAGADGITRIWDGHSKRLIRALPGGHKAINAVAFNPKGDTLVTAGADGITRIWDGHSKRLIRALPGGHKAINAIAFNRSKS